MDKLKGKQKELDANNDGKISGEDFELLRERKNKGGLLNIANKIIEDTSEDVGYPIYQNYTSDRKIKIDSNEIDRMNNYLYQIILVVLLKYEHQMGQELN